MNPDLPNEKRPESHELTLKPDSDPVGIDLVAEKKLVRKLDLHIIPILTLLYLCSFLDR